MPKKVPIADDEEPVSNIVKFNLTKEGFEVNTAYDGEGAVKEVSGINPSLMTLGLVLPRKDGLEVARGVRQTHGMLIIMVTAKDTEIDKVLSLEMGVGDYVTRPFSSRESVVRMKANLCRRDIVRRQVDENENENKNVTIGSLAITPDAYIVGKDGQKTELTHREFELLHYLTSHMEQIMTREHLLQTAWGYDYFGDVRAIDVTVHRLRKRIEDNPIQPKILVTRRDVGYYVKDPNEG